MSLSDHGVLLRQVDRVLAHTFALKRAPADYRRTVDQLAGWLSKSFKEVAGPLVDTAAQDLAAIMDAGGDTAANRRKAEKRIGELVAALEASGERLDDSDAATLSRYLATSYRLGLKELSTATGWRVDFTLADQDAIAGLTEAGLFWVSGQHGRAFSSARAMRQVQDVMITRGMGRRAGGRALAAAFQGQIARSDVYWRGLAATMATRSRSLGALRGMEATGAVTYEYQNPGDERTSPVCDHLNGTIYTVAGAIILREALATAATPDDYKAIAPWPRLADIEGLGAAELQARGVAWPPLHFHCRSAISVRGWTPPGEGEADVLGQVAPPAPPPPDPTPLEPTPAGPPARSWREASRALAAHDTRIESAGLTPGAWALSPELRLDFARYEPNQSRMLGKVAATRGAMPRRSIMAAIGDLELDSKRRTKGARALVKRARAEVALLDTRELLQRQAVEVAPASVLDAWRVEAARALFKSRARFGQQRQAVTAEVMADALRLYPVDQLQALVSEGFKYVHDPKRKRAHAVHGSDRHAGYGEQNLSPLTRRWGGKWIASRDARAMATLSHEVGHLFDQFYGGTGLTGEAWTARPAYPEAPAWWEQAWGGPYRRTRAGMAITLPGEKGGSGRYMWAGNWVRAYEARIYSPGKGAPTAADLASRKAGPIEFIAKGVEYRGEARRTLERYTRARASSSVAKLAAARLRGSHLSRARALYGVDYRDGGEAWTGAGLQVVRDQVEGSGYKFKNDGDVYGFALTVHVHFGTPLESLIGDGGILRGYLHRDATPEPGQLAVLVPDYAAPESVQSDQLEAAVTALANQHKQINHKANR